MNRIYGHTIKFFLIEFYNYNFKKPNGHLSLCLLESIPPCFMPTNHTDKCSMDKCRYGSTCIIRFENGFLRLENGKLFRQNRA